MSRHEDKFSPITYALAVSGSSGSSLTPEQEAILGSWMIENDDLVSKRDVYIPTLYNDPRSLWLGTQVHVQDGGNTLAYTLEREPDIMRSCVVVGFDDTGTKLHPRTLNVQPLATYTASDRTGYVNNTEIVTFSTHTPTNGFGKAIGIMVDKKPTRPIEVKVIVDDTYGNSSIIRDFKIPVDFWTDDKIGVEVFYDEFAPYGLYENEEVTIEINVELETLVTDENNVPFLKFKVQYFTMKNLATEEYVDGKLTAFNEKGTYNKGDLVYQDGKIFKCFKEGTYYNPYFERDIEIKVDEMDSDLTEFGSADYPKLQLYQRFVPKNNGTITGFSIDLKDTMDSSEAYLILYKCIGDSDFYKFEALEIRQFNYIEGQKEYILSEPIVISNDMIENDELALGINITPSTGYYSLGLVKRSNINTPGYMIGSDNYTLSYAYNSTNFDIVPHIGQIIQGYQGSSKYRVGNFFPVFQTKAGDWVEVNDINRRSVEDKIKDSRTLDLSKGDNLLIKRQNTTEHKTLFEQNNALIGTVQQETLYTAEFYFTPVAEEPFDLYIESDAIPQTGLEYGVRVERTGNFYPCDSEGNLYIRDLYKDDSVGFRCMYDSYSALTEPMNEILYSLYTTDKFKTYEDVLFEQGRVNASLNGTIPTMSEDERLVYSGNPIMVYDANTGEILFFNGIEWQNLNNEGDSPYKDKIAVFLGDSQTEENYHKTKTYCDWVKEKLQLGVISNYGLSGSTIAKKSASDNNAFCERYKNMIANADIIFVMGGVNDVWFSSELGKIDDTSNLTFYGAMNNLCNGLYTKYPDKQIVFITPTEEDNSSCVSDKGYVVSDFANAMRTVCAKHSIPIFDANACVGIYPYNQINADLYTTDKLHLNDRGHELLGEKLSSFVFNGCISNAVVISSGGDEPQPTDPWIGKTFSATGKKYADFYHLTLLVASDSDCAYNSVVTGHLKGHNLVNVTDTSMTGGSIFGDDSGDVTNSQYTTTYCGNVPFNPVVDGDNLTINFPERTFNADLNGEPYIKIPIMIALTELPCSFTIDEIDIYINGNKKDIIKIGGFFTEETYTIT